MESNTTVDSLPIRSHCSSPDFFDVLTQHRSPNLAVFTHSQGHSQAVKQRTANPARTKNASNSVAHHRNVPLGLGSLSQVEALQEQSVTADHEHPLTEENQQQQLTRSEYHQRYGVEGFSSRQNLSNYNPLVIDTGNSQQSRECEGQKEQMQSELSPLCEDSATGVCIIIPSSA